MTCEGAGSMHSLAMSGGGGAHSEWGVSQIQMVPSSSAGLRVVSLALENWMPRTGARWLRVSGAARVYKALTRPVE